MMIEKFKKKSSPKLTDKYALKSYTYLIYGGSLTIGGGKKYLF